MRVNPGVYLMFHCGALLPSFAHHLFVKHRKAPPQFGGVPAGKSCSLQFSDFAFLEAKLVGGLAQRTPSFFKEVTSDFWQYAWTLACLKRAFEFEPEVV
jgi:hypothetical protein